MPKKVASSFCKFSQRIYKFSRRQEKPRIFAVLCQDQDLDERNARSLCKAFERSVGTDLLERCRDMGLWRIKTI